MKSAEELKKLEGSISKSSAPSKTKPVTERLFRNTGEVGAGMDRERLPQAKTCEIEDMMED